MRKSYSTIISSFMVISLTANAIVVDWSEIKHWAGEGENKAALVVQFDDDGEEKAYVWGYRWNGEEITPSGEDMFRAIATECDDIYLFTQFTGWMGNTVCGIGYSRNNSIADCIEFDFDSALEDPNISFNWFSANSFLGQTSVPGWSTPELCEEAIEESKATHILEHPIDARNYGYACYDYDHWQKFGGESSMRWNAGWYQGYWSYWVGGVDMESLSYSGLGYTSRKLTDESVDGWKYTPLSGPVGGDYVDGVTGATTQWHELDYRHFLPTSVEAVSDELQSSENVLFRLDGSRVAKGALLPPGIYILKTQERTEKIIIR
ncbi:MAG: hypothetical protein HDS24_01465 [Bacteroides sp.]|nr:hypothetical protein [Bacteroides sp.]